VSRRGAALALAVALALAGSLAGCGRGGGAGAAAPTQPAVWQVTIRAPGQPVEVATAFAADAGRAVTVAHALSGQRAVLVARPGGGTRRVHVMRTDERLDLALLSVPGVEAPAVQTAKPHAGQDASVLVVRSARVRTLPATVRRLVTARVRNAPDAVAQVRPALELDATVMPGDSGAPVLDRDGHLIGMVFAQASERDDRAYALDTRALPSAAR
jgi:S1-C subfamily serine protease